MSPRRDVYTVPGTGDPEGVLPDRVFGAGQELEFLGGLDFLVVALPLTKATEGVIGERELRALPRTAYVAQSRPRPDHSGGVRARGAPRDVGSPARRSTPTTRYPMPPDHPLWRFPNVIFTPHIAGSSLSPRFKQRTVGHLRLNVVRFAAGEPLLNELTPAELVGD